MASYQAIAVAGFVGSNGEQVTSAVEAAIRGSSVRGYRAIKVIPRNDVSTTLRGRAVTLDTALEVGLKHGVDAIVFGEITQSTSASKSSNRTETECISNKNESNTLKKLFSCKESRNVTVQCTERAATFSVFVRVYDTSRRELLLAEEVSATKIATGCKDQPILTEKEALATAYQAAMADLQRLLVPTEITTRVELMRIDDAVKSSAAKQGIENALDFAKGGRADRACELFRTAFDEEKQSPALTYNMGVCEEHSGEPWKAYELYQTSDRLSTKPIDVISKALERTKGSLRNQQTIAAARPELAKATGLASPASVGRKEFAAAGPIKVSSEQIQQAVTEKRLALVIGNASYKQKALRNPLNDASDMAKALQKAGFEVMTVFDGTTEKMRLAIEEFGNRAPENGVALFYYSGHASSADGQNYLWPTDQSFQRESDYMTKAINAQEVLTKMEHARTRINLVILDSCRDNPVAGKRSGKNGLAMMDAPTGTLLAYSAAPGKTADDGTGRNGLYTSYLLQEIGKPNLKVEDVFKNVRLAIRAEKGSEQVPWETSSLTGDFFFTARTQ